MMTPTQNQSDIFHRASSNFHHAESFPMVEVATGNITDIKAPVAEDFSTNPATLFLSMIWWLKKGFHCNTVVLAKRIKSLQV